jgi:hypothetical protein
VLIHVYVNRILILAILPGFYVNRISILAILPRFYCVFLEVFICCARLNGIDKN